MAKMSAKIFAVFVISCVLVCTADARKLIPNTNPLGEEKALYPNYDIPSFGTGVEGSTQTGFGGNLGGLGGSLGGAASGSLGMGSSIGSGLGGGMGSSLGGATSGSLGMGSSLGGLGGMGSSLGGSASGSLGMGSNGAGGDVSGYGFGPFGGFGGRP